MSLTQETFDSLVQLAMAREMPKFRDVFIKHYCEQEKEKPGFETEYGVHYFDKVANKNNQLKSFSEEEIVQVINEAFATNYSYTPPAESDLESFKKEHPVYRTFKIASEEETILVPVTPYTTMQDIKEYIAEHLYQDKSQASQIAIASGKRLVSDKRLFLHCGDECNDMNIGSIVLLDQHVPQASPHQLNLANHYRVWFSNDENSFLPPVERTIIETSIELNPAISSHLIVNSDMLSPLSKGQLKKWGEENNCAIIDIAALDLESELDKLILLMAKAELTHWTSGNKLGNPGLASDLVRLLFIDQGVYFDCDILTFENIPTELTTRQAAITAFLDIPLGALNNNLMAFSSEAGKETLQKFKQVVVAKYFGKLKPCAENIAAVMNEREKACEGLSKEDLRTHLDKLVTNTSGPWVLREFCDGVSPPINNLESEVIDYLQHVCIDAGRSFEKLKSVGLNVDGCSWLPGSQKGKVDDKVLKELMSEFKTQLKLQGVSSRALSL